MKLATLATALLLLGAPSTAAIAAEDSLITADPQVVIDALTAAGYAGKLSPYESGAPSIAVKISGLNTYIDFYNCDDDYTNCQTLLFGVSLDLNDGTTPGKANKWNSDKIMGRVWLNDDSDPTLDFSMVVAGGISQAVFEENVRRWDANIGDFKDFFDFR